MKFRIINQQFIMTAAALMVFLITLGFALEPLITVISRSRQLPTGTTVVMRIPQSAQFPYVLSQTQNLLRSFGADPSHPLLASCLQLGLNLPGKKTLSVSTVAAIGEPVSFTITANSERSQALGAFKRMVSRALPTEEEFTLPDETKAVEIVADPEKVELTYERRGQTELWFVNGALTLALRIQGGEVSFTTSPGQWQEANQYSQAMSCRTANEAMRILTVLPTSTGPLLTLINSLSAYFSDFSCFQTFSAFSA